MKSTNYHFRPLGLLFLFCFVPLWVLAQTISITGVVRDASGEGVIGASVLEVGTTNGAITDFEGNFTLKVKPQARLNISFIGYQTQTVNIGSRTNIEITLVEDTKLLDEVVVVGYGTQRRSDVTGAIASVGESTLKEVPAANMAQALQGRVAGISINQTSTRPGQSGQIRIRGSRSLSASNDPLIVLDGIPFGGGMNDINPSDIKTIDILKDASATAIYGARGANGVILITTHRGVTGEAKVNYNGSYGIKTVAQRYEVLNAEEFLRLREITGAFKNLDQENEMIAAGKSTDWQDLIYQDGFVTQHDLNVSGGTPKGQYSLGAGYYKETTVLAGQDFARYSLRATIDQEIGKFIKIGLSTQNNYGVTNGESASFMYQALTLSPVAPAYNADGTIYKQPTYPTDNYYNPLLVNDADTWAQRRKRFSSFNSLYAELKFTDYLKYRANVGLNYRQDNYGHFYGKETPFRNGAVSQAAVQNGIATSYTIENLLYFDKTFAKKHKVNAVLMFSAQEDESNNSRMEATDIAADYMLYYNLGNYNEGTGSISIPSGSQTYYKRAILSYMFRANYAYDNKYMLTLTGRRDGASVLAKGHEWHDYPAVSVGWNITNEEWAKNIPGVDMIKLRAGYGETANQSADPYSTLGGLSQNKYNYGDDYVFGYYVSNLANEKLGWEHTATYNVGLDFYLFNERLTGAIEWYSQRTTDLLVQQNLPPTSGVPSAIWVNVGETRNTGMEFSLTGKIFDNKDFQWAVDANIYFNKNKIMKLNSGVEKDESKGWFVGKPIDVIYDYKKLGIWQLDEAAEAEKYGFKPGQVKIADISGVDGVPDGKITADDRTIIGNYAPDFEGGFTSRMNYKNFDFTVVAFYRVGGTLVSTLHQSGSYLNMLQGRRNQIKVDYWTPTNPTNKFPMPDATDQPVSGTYGGTLGYYDAGFMKIRSMTLGYSLPKGFLQESLGFSSARVYFMAQNPFVFFSNYMKEGGVDPEATGTGNQGSGASYGAINSRHLTIGLNTPPTRSFIFGLNLSF